MNINKISCLYQVTWTWTRDHGTVTNPDPQQIQFLTKVPTAKNGSPKGLRWKKSPCVLWWNPPSGAVGLETAVNGECVK